MTTLAQGIRTFNQRRATEAALQNELATRRRVTEAEHRLSRLEERLRRVEGVFGRRFWGRLNWLVRGK
jgi:hypothetical protein